MTEALRVLRNGRTAEGVKVKWQTELRCFFKWLKSVYRG